MRRMKQLRVTGRKRKKDYEQEIEKEGSKLSNSTIYDKRSQGKVENFVDKRFSKW